MRSIALLSAIAAASVTSAVAQVTAEILQPDFLQADDQLQGEIIGVGAEGTTYVISNIVTDTLEDLAYTGTPALTNFLPLANHYDLLIETVVQDGNHFSMILDATMDPSNAVSLNIQCTYATLDPSATGLAGDCFVAEQDVVDGSTAASSASASGSLVPVPIAVSTASGVSATSASGSASGSGSSGLKTTNSPTSGSTASSSGPSPTTTSGAMAMKLGAVGIIALPVLSILAFLL